MQSSRNMAGVLGHGWLPGLSLMCRSVLVFLFQGYRGVEVELGFVDTLFKGGG